MLCCSWLHSSSYGKKREHDMLSIFTHRPRRKNLPFRKVKYSAVLIYYILKLFLPVFFIALLFFILILELGDTFYNLNRFIETNTPMSTMFTVIALYLPKCVSYSAPIAMLFAGSYTLGSLYAKKELMVVFSSGISLQRFVFPILLFAFFCSLGMFFFEDALVISTFAKKNDILENLNTEQKNRDASNIAVMSEQGQVIYIAEYYSSDKKILHNAKIIHKNEDGVFDIIILAEKVHWIEETQSWELVNPNIYNISDDGVKTVYKTTFDFLTEPPSSFENIIVNVDNLKAEEAKKFLLDLEKKGIPKSEYTVKYYQRFSFPFTIFIVLFLSISFGGYLKKNILLMSLLFSLSVAVLYYVSQMLMTVLASWGAISPIIAAWLPFVLFFLISVYLVKIART